MIRNSERLKDNAATLPFDKDEEGLIEYHDPDFDPRLCVPNYDGLIEDVFRLTHDEMGYPG